MKSEFDIVTMQNTIIRKQSDIIDSLFGRLSMLCAADELESFPEVADMRKVAQFKREVAE